MSFTSYFYPRVKEQIDYLKGIRSKDTQNRKVPNQKEIKRIPKLPKLSTESKSFMCLLF